MITNPPPFQVGDWVRYAHGAFRYRIVAISGNGALFCAVESRPGEVVRFAPEEQSILKRITAPASAALDEESSA